jgi:hypothetical protein
MKRIQTRLCEIVCKCVWKQLIKCGHMRYKHVIRVPLPSAIKIFASALMPLTETGSNISWLDRPRVCGIITRLDRFSYIWTLKWFYNTHAEHAVTIGSLYVILLVARRQVQASNNSERRWIDPGQVLRCQGLKPALFPLYVVLVRLSGLFRVHVVFRCS